MKKIILLLFISTFYIYTYSQNQAGNQSEWNSPNIQENNSFSEPKIYPNPCKQENVTIELYTSEISEIRITNIAGKEVLLKKFQHTENKKQIQLTEIPNGIYLVKTKTTDGKTVVKKLIIAKN